MKVHRYFSCLLAITTLVVGAHGFNGSEPTSTYGTPSNIGRILLQKADIVAEVDKSGMVAINGSGFLANEPVFVTIEAGSASMLPSVVLAQWIVFADGLGTVRSNWQMTDLAGIYKIAAVGGNSGRLTDTYFTGPMSP